jgi:DNA helicase IV
MTTVEPLHPEFASEQEFLQHAAKCLSAMRDEIAAAGDAGGDPKASAALARHREKILERLENPDTVLFGRINLDGGDKYYIGPRGIRDTGGLIVINWAAPVAKSYYEATPTEPAGLTLRRRFRTERERLLSIADEWFGTAAVEPTIGDILLDELGRERTAEMRQVAATIQSDQYRIIERALDSPMIVQGGPGTGKTIVGLHRAALLLYRHREQLTARRVLVVGPNRVFMRYIAYVLPSLGETAVDQVVVDNLVDLHVDGRDDHLVARVKGDQRIAEVLRRAVVDRVRPPSEDIGFSAHGLAFSLKSGVVAELVRDYDARVRSFVNARVQFRAALDRAVGEAYRTESQRLQPGRVPTPLSTPSMPEFDRALDRIWPSITAPELVRQLLASEERIDRASEGVLNEVEKRLLYRKPVERLEQVRWSTSDMPLVDEVQELIEPTARRYGHVILDEAQDLTPMQLRMVGRRISRGSATVLGDLAQATGLWSYRRGTSRWRGDRLSGRPRVGRLARSGRFLDSDRRAFRARRLLLRSLGHEVGAEREAERRLTAHVLLARARADPGAAARADARRAWDGRGGDVSAC